MNYRIEVKATGDLGALEQVPVDVLEPGPGEVWLTHEAIGVNYLDVMQRKGTAPLPVPSGLGVEGVGRVEKLGAGVTNVKVGDRVGYVLGIPGGYATGRLYPASRLIALPDSLASDAAAAVLMKGITAHYLLTSTYVVAPGTDVVLYGAAGALGQIIARWSNALGANVIGIVSRESSIERARQAGCAAVMLWGRDDIPAGVRLATQGKGAHVVYDGVGKATLMASLDSLRPRGLLASIGSSSGPPPAVEFGTLNAKGSIYVTRPSLAAHASDAAEYQTRASAVLAAVEQGLIVPKVWKRLPLRDAREAHRLLDEGRAEGALVLTP